MNPPDLPRCLSGVPIAADLDSLFLPRADRPLSRRDGNSLVIAVRGVLTHRAQGGFTANTAVVDIQSELRRAERTPGIKRVVLDMDSAGGVVAGIPELADRLHAMRTPVVSVIQEAAGVAYWVAAQAGEVVIAPSGEAGGVGIVAHHDDLSDMMSKAGIKRELIAAGRYKTEAHPFAPLDAAAELHLQKRVNELHRMFVAHVSRGRKVSEATVRRDFGKGRMLSANHAIDAGMADAVGTLDEVLSDPRARRRAMKAQRFRRAFA